MIGVDLETTGVDARTSAIVELGLEIMAPGLPVKEYRTLVNPVLPIPPEATAIHGITNAMVADAPTFVQLSVNLLKGLQNCDYAGYSVRFDLKQLSEEFKRAGKQWSYDGARVLCGHRLWQLAEGRKLTDAVNRWLKNDSVISPVDFEVDAPHTALWDVKMSTRVIAAQLADGKLPPDLDQLHELQWPGWIDADGKLRRLASGMPAFTFGAHRDVPLSRVPRSYLENFILKADFSDAVKTEVRKHL